MSLTNKGTNIGDDSLGLTLWAVPVAPPFKQIYLFKWKTIDVKN